MYTPYQIIYESLSISLSSCYISISSSQFESSLLYIVLSAYLAFKLLLPNAVLIRRIAWRERGTMRVSFCSRLRVTDNWRDQTLVVARSSSFINLCKIQLRTTVFIVLLLMITHWTQLHVTQIAFPYVGSINDLWLTYKKVK